MDGAHSLMSRSRAGRTMRKSSPMLARSCRQCWAMRFPAKAPISPSSPLRRSRRSRHATSRDRGLESASKNYLPRIIAGAALPVECVKASDLTPEQAGLKSFEFRERQCHQRRLRSTTLSPKLRPRLGAFPRRQVNVKWPILREIAWCFSTENECPEFLDKSASVF